MFWISSCSLGSGLTDRAQRYEIPEESLLVSRFPEVPISNILNFEGIANRDSFPYAETYGLKADTVRTLLRGTLRSLNFTFRLYHLIDSRSGIPGIVTWSNLSKSLAC